MMVERASWIVALKGIAWVAIMTLLMGWLGRSRLKRRPEAQSNRLVNPTSLLVFFGFAFLTTFALCCLGLFFGNPDERWIVLALFSLPGSCLYFVRAYFVDRHVVTPEGLTYTTIRASQKTIRWSDVVAIRYAFVMKWFTIEDRTGQKARLSATLMGLPEFARLALEHAPKPAIDKETEDILRETAAGRPPSVW